MCPKFHSYLKGTQNILCHFEIDRPSKSHLPIRRGILGWFHDYLHDRFVSRNPSRRKMWNVSKSPVAAGGALYQCSNEPIEKVDWCCTRAKKLMCWLWTDYKWCARQIYAGQTTWAKRGEMVFLWSQMSNQGPLDTVFDNEIQVHMGRP